MPLVSTDATGRVTPYSEGGLPEGIGHGSRLKLHHYPLTTAVDRRRACAILNFLGLPRRSPLSDHKVGILLSPGRDFRQTLHHAT